MTGAPPEDEGPWISEEAWCSWCATHWVAVHPCAAALECPACHQYTPSKWAEEHGEWLKENDFP